MKITKREIILFCLFSVLLMISMCSDRRKLQYNDQNWQSITDQIQYNLDSSEAHLKTIIGGKRKTIRRLLHTRDSMNIALAKAIKEAGRNTKGVTIINTKTLIRDTIPTEIIRIDTFIVDNVIKEFPVYHSFVKNKWITYTVTAGADSIYNFIGIFDQINVRWEKRGRYTEVYARNENPYTKTIGLKSWMIENSTRGQMDYGVFAGAQQNLFNREFSGGGYFEIKYKLLTAEVSAGIITGGGTLINPMVEAKLKYAFKRHQY